MNDPTQVGQDRLRVALDRGDVVELDGGTLILDGTETESVVLRLAPWRAHSLSLLLEDWTAACRIFYRDLDRPDLTELELSRVLHLAAAVAGERTDNLAFLRGRSTPPGSTSHRARLRAVAILAERVPRLTVTQRLALVDAASWWLSDTTAGGPDLARALLEATCDDHLAAELTYLALITPPDAPPPPGDPSSTEPQATAADTPGDGEERPGQ
jgi:hypothetical protein